MIRSLCRGPVFTCAALLAATTLRAAPATQPAVKGDVASVHAAVENAIGLLDEKRYADFVDQFVETSSLPNVSKYEFTKLIEKASGDVRSALVFTRAVTPTFEEDGRYAVFALPKNTDSPDTLYLEAVDGVWRMLDDAPKHRSEPQAPTTKPN